MFVVLIMSVILSISLGISAIFIQENKIMTEIGYSVLAFYAADAGIEMSMMENPPISIEAELENGASYKVLVKVASTTIPADCDALNYCIKSIGNYKNVKRAIQVRY